MDSLVNALRTSKSSLYNHFDSKDALVEAVVSQLNEEINQKLESILNDDKLSFKGKLIAISAFTKELLESVSEEFLTDLEIHTPEIWTRYQQMRQDRINKYYRALFETGIREGAVRDDIRIELILSAYLSLTEIPLRFGQISRLAMPNEDIYEAITQIFLEGIVANK